MNKIDELKKVMNYEKEYLNLTSSQANMRINLAIDETVKVVEEEYGRTRNGCQVNLAYHNRKVLEAFEHGKKVVADAVLCCI